MYAATSMPAVYILNVVDRLNDVLKVIRNSQRVCAAHTSTASRKT